MLAALSAVASAQDEACPPYAMERWRAELGAARAAYDGMQIERAAGLVDELHREARCLEAPVAAADLGTFARLQAVRWMYEQDPEGMTSWSSLADQVDPDGDWPVPADHPIRRMVVAEGQEGTLAGPSGLGVAHPKHGGVFVDGAFLVDARVRTGQPHLVQVFDGSGVRIGGWWQDGAAFREELLTDVPVTADPPRWWTGEDAAEDDVPVGFAAARRDTPDAYRRYLQRSPTGEHAAWARRRLDDLDWRAAAEAGTAEAARGYLAEWPDGRSRQAAEGVLEGEAFRRASAEGTASALELFRSRYPRGAYAAEATRRLDDLAWNAAEVDRTPKAYANYRLRWPKGVHVREARLAQEELEWLAAAGGPEAALRAYLSAWPTGNHVDVAQVALAGARFTTVAIGVELAGPVPEVVAKAVHEALAEQVRAEGLAVVRVPGGPPPALSLGTARLWVRLSGAAVGPSALALEASLDLRVPGVSRPLAEGRVSASADPADPMAGVEVAARLAELLPALARWSPPPR